MKEQYEKVDNETAMVPISDALFALGYTDNSETSDLAEQFLQYIHEAEFKDPFDNEIHSITISQIEFLKVLYEGVTGNKLKIE